MTSAISLRRSATSSAFAIAGAMTESAGHDVDAQFSLTGAWQIPTEAMGHLCLLMAADDARSTFQVGVVRITADILNAGNNKDGKKTARRQVRCSRRCSPRASGLP